MPRATAKALSKPQWQLLDEINEAGVLYVRRWGQFHRTVESLVRKGLVMVVEPDHSSLGQDGYSLTIAGSVCLGVVDG